MRIRLMAVVMFFAVGCASAFTTTVMAGMRSHEADLPPLRTRGVDELKLMNEAELQGEAARACDYAKTAATWSDRALNDGRTQDSIRYSQVFADTEEYLDRIRLVIRERTGTMPEWYKTLVAESWRKESPRRCLDAVKSR
jgi:uncharacterized lipoprotein NlpE involved in copper resistance